MQFAHEVLPTHPQRFKYKHVDVFDMEVRAVLTHSAAPACLPACLQLRKASLLAHLRVSSYSRTKNVCCRSRTWCPALTPPLPSSRRPLTQVGPKAGGNQQEFSFPRFM